MTQSQSLFSQDELSKLAKSEEGNSALSLTLQEEIKNHLAREIHRCIETCPPLHLAHLALGNQELGVHLRKNNLSFAIRFFREPTGGLSDPFEPRVWSEFLLPDIAGIAQDGEAWELLFEMAQLAGLRDDEQGKLTKGTSSEEKRLAGLMQHGIVTDEIRRRVKVYFESCYLPTLDDVPEAILHSMCERARHKAWVAQQRKIKAQAKRQGSIPAV